MINDRHAFTFPFMHPVTFTRLDIFTLSLDISAVILSIRTEDLDSVMLAAHAAGLTGGSHALFLSKAHVSMRGTLQAGQLLLPAPASLNSSDSNFTSLQEAYRATFILHAQPNPLLLDTDNSTNRQVKKSF